MDIYAFQTHLTRKLAAWAGLNLAAGAALQAAPDDFWRSFGQQAAGWAAVNAAIAFFGQRSLQQRLAAGSPQEAAARAPAEQTNLARLLWLNAALDLLYIAGGAWLTRRGGRRSAGHGWGIVFQGAFLFIFDLAHALRLGKS